MDRRYDDDDDDDDDDDVDRPTDRPTDRLVHEFFAAQPAGMSFGKPAAEVEIASREIGFHDNGANRFQRFPGNQNAGKGAGSGGPASIRPVLPGDCKFLDTRDRTRTT